MAAISCQLSFESNRRRPGARRAYRAATRHFDRLRQFRKAIDTFVEQSSGDVRERELTMLLHGHKVTVWICAPDGLPGMTPEIADRLLAALTNVSATDNELRTALEPRPMLPAPRPVYTTAIDLLQ
jgi:hypothetical protein